MSGSVRQEFEAVIFALFGVVIAFDNDVVYRRLADHCADPCRAVGELDGLMAERPIITGEIGLADVHRRLVEEQGLTLDLDEFTEAWLKPYSRPMPGMGELIAELTARYRILLLSNIDRYYWEIVQDMQPELGLFDELLLSCDLGMAKPDPEIFRRAARAAGVAPAGCVFVDDTAANVDAAREIGMSAVRFRDTASLRAELAAIGV